MKRKAVIVGSSVLAMLVIGGLVLALGGNSSPPSASTSAGPTSLSALASGPGPGPLRRAEVAGASVEVPASWPPLATHGSDIALVIYDNASKRPGEVASLTVRAGPASGAPLRQSVVAFEYLQRALDSKWKLGSATPIDVPNTRGAYLIEARFIDRSFGHPTSVVSVDLIARGLHGRAWHVSALGRPTVIDQAFVNDVVMSFKPNS